MKLSFTYRSRLPYPVETVFQWHERPGAFDRLNPPWFRVSVIDRTGGIRDGDRVSLRVWIPPAWRRWVIEHRDYQENKQFRDIQLSGPFSFWEHTHRFHSDGPDACILEDSIEYTPPLGYIGNLLGGWHIRLQLLRVFQYRHNVTQADIAAHQRFIHKKPLRLLISGSSGLIGSALYAFLSNGEHSVYRFVRKISSLDERSVLLPQSSVDTPIEKMEGFDAIVHLAGENIAGRWTESKKQRIRNSRIEGTRLLCENLARLKNPPSTLISASAIGYYGNRGDEVLNEQSGKGNDFLADTCQEWEEATEPARRAGIRVVNIRIGIVLTTAGGALAQMRIPFRIGLGGVIGSGNQYMSWISLDDVLYAIHHALMNDTLAGPVNLVAPHPVTNREFTRTLGSVLHRPTLFPLPAWILKGILGEMGESLLLSSTRVIPQCLLDSGYLFRYARLETALRHALGYAPNKGSNPKHSELLPLL